MAFHVACPITCRRICFCDLGFPSKLQNEKGKNDFLEEVFRIEEFIKDPWLLKAEANATVQVKVPKVAIVVPPPLLPPPIQVSASGSVGDGAGVGDVDETALAISAQTKRAALQKRAAAASLVAEDYVRRFESGEVANAGTVKNDAGTVKNDAGEDQSLSNAKVMCRLCFGGENEGSERARKMLPCNSCGKKYHRGCLKSWAQHRDLFHWSSWSCPSCRICEVCRRTGEPSKFMFCKRCDGAYHCYCQHPPHKNVGSGPYLCPKHTKCHSCGSNVPGNGLSVRWFLGYTCCDACGRLFVKGNYCPVCLKVYRDSEATPMVCCDVCQRWVHCQCDGISDAKYLQFQVDGNLQYVCPTCRGECYQVRNLEEAVQELWRRRDEADKDLIANLRAAVGLPSQEEIFSISPFSDDEENGPAVLKHEYGRSLKFSLKGLVEKSPKKSKDYGKKSSNKKYSKKKGNLVSPAGGGDAHQSFEGHDDASSFGYASGDNRNEQMQPSRGGEPDSLVSRAARSLIDGTSSGNTGVLKQKLIDEVTASNGNRAPRTVKIKNSKLKGSSNTGDDTGNQNSTVKSTQGPKIVIHLGNRNKKMASSPRSDASSYQKDQDLTTSNGSEDMGGSGLNDSLDKQDTAAKFCYGKAVDETKGPKLRGKEGNLIKIRKTGTEASDLPPRFSGERLPDATESVSAVSTRSSLVKRGVEDNTAALRVNSDLPVTRSSKLSSVMNDDSNRTPSASHLQKEPKLLKFKFKNPITDSHSSWTPKEEERSSVKGQRSKRKRPSPLQEKASNKGDGDDDAPPSYDDNSMDEIMDANWILQKLGKDAIGKRVEVHQPSDNSWNKGTVREVFEGSLVSVSLDNGKSRNLELGKQGIRFISQKRRRC